MGRTTEEYRLQLQSLMPKGSAWKRLLSSVLGKLLYALGDSCHEYSILRSQ